MHLTAIKFCSVGTIDELKNEMNMNLLKKQKDFKDHETKAENTKTRTKLNIERRGHENEAISNSKNDTKEKANERESEKSKEYKAKPLSKMTDTMKKLKMAMNNGLTSVKEEKNTKKETKKVGADVNKQKKWNNDTHASKSSIVNESEATMPTENWLIKVTNSAKKKDGQQMKSGNKIARKSKNPPTISGNGSEGSTPTRQTLKPTTIQETAQKTVTKFKSTGTPSLKPTTEAASTPSQVNEAESSGSGAKVNELEERTNDNHTSETVREIENEKVLADEKLNQSNVKDEEFRTNNDENAESDSGDEEGEIRDGVINDENKPAKDIEKRILCVGDSITEGYYKGGVAFHPYSKRLSELLNAEKNHISYIVYNEGKSGECVNPEMIKKMPQFMEKYNPLNLVIIIGGTNDFTNKNCNERDLFNDIKTLHELAHKAGVRTVAVTIPDSNAPQLPGRNEKEGVWENVNDKIRDYAKGNDKVILCDLAEELPFRTMNDDEKKLFWDDDLHYTPMGYDKMAEIIYDVIQGNF